MQVSKPFYSATGKHAIFTSLCIRINFSLLWVSAIALLTGQKLQVGRCCCCCFRMRPCCNHFFPAYPRCHSNAIVLAPCKMRQTLAPRCYRLASRLWARDFLASNAAGSNWRRVQQLNNRRHVRQLQLVLLYTRSIGLPADTHMGMGAAKAGSTPPCTKKLYRHCIYSPIATYKVNKYNSAANPSWDFN